MDPSVPQEAARSVTSRIEKEIESRIGLTTSLTQGIDPESDDEIEEMRESGWLVDISVAEVEAAILAARRTPGKDDDLAAWKLACRVSCRFYIDPKEFPSIKTEVHREASPEEEP